MMSKNTSVRFSVVDRFVAGSYALLRRLRAKLVRLGDKNPACGPLGLLFLGHGMLHGHKAAFHPGSPQARTESWLESLLAQDDLGIQSFRNGGIAGRQHFASIPYQYRTVYRDNLVHFFSALCQIEPRSGFFEESLLSAGEGFVPFFHSSGLSAAGYLAGCATIDHALRISLRGADLLAEEEDRLSREDLERFLPILGSYSDLVRKAVARVRQHVVAVLKDIPGCLEAFDKAVERKGLGLGKTDRMFLERALHARLTCLSGFGPRPYGLGDAERLVEACRERGLSVEVAVVNAENCVILGGPAYDLAVAEVLAREGAVGRVPFLISKVLVDGAPHTSRYAGAAARFGLFLEGEIEKGRLRDPVIPFVGSGGILVRTARDVREQSMANLDKRFVFDGACAAVLERSPRGILMVVGQGRTPGYDVAESVLLDLAAKRGSVPPPILRAGDLAAEGPSRTAAWKVVVGTPSSNSSKAEAASTFDDLDNVRKVWEDRLAGFRRSAVTGPQRKDRDVSYATVSA